VAVSPSPEARRDSSVERFQFLRELGSCAVPTWAALETLAERSQLVVVERVRHGAIDDPSIADWLRGARRLATLEHPNVGRVRDIVTVNDELVIVSDFIDGVRWKDLASCAQPPPLEVAIRVLVDVLSGLGALHNLRDAERRPLKLVHGALTPDCVIVGQDGVTRVVAASRARTIASRPTDAGSAYFAPEVLLEDDSSDPRADVYSVGVMLWEALSGRPLFADMQASAIVTHLLSGRVPPATVPAAVAWAAPLADAASRALSVDPEKRFASASAMAAELRRVTATRLPAPVRVAALVRTVFGDSIRTRREELERGEVRASAAPRAESVPSGADGPI
jgi:eukaryotic-like serine/threonine-protein kinase